MQNNVWTDDLNWTGGDQPGTLSTARINLNLSTGSFETITISNPQGQPSTIASVGTLLLESPEADYVRIAPAKNVMAPPGATYNFPSAARIVLSMSPDPNVEFDRFAIGIDPEGFGVLQWPITGSVTMQSRGTTTSAPRQSLIINSKVTGSGSLVVAALTLTGAQDDGVVSLGASGDSSTVRTSTFDGGVFVQGGVLAIGASSEPAFSTAVTNGPLGKAR